MTAIRIRPTARRLAWPLGLVLTSFVATAMASQLAQQPASPPSAGRADRLVPVPPSGGRRQEEEKAGERLREGTRLVDVTGSFQFSGDRVTFHPDGKGESYRVLENLALDRIGRQLGQTRGSLTWTVSGLVTEYRNSNYLLVTKAVEKSTVESAVRP
jgi:hypothetical protein